MNIAENCARVARRIEELEGVIGDAPVAEPADVGSATRSG